MAATATIKTRSIQAEALSAATDRLINSILLSEGVVNKAGNSFKVAENLGTDMKVKVGSATAYDRAVVQGDTAGQGVHVVEHQNASQVLSVAAADATNPRIDIVILRVYDDTFDSSGKSYADLEVITGTAAASPTAPAIPSSAIKLAQVAVAAGATAITNANITDYRVETGIVPRVLPVARARALDNAGGTITTTEAIKLTATLTIPADWVTYDIDAYCGLTVYESGAMTAQQNVNAYLRVDTVSGTILALATVELPAAEPNRFAVPLIGYLTGETATGSRSVHLTLSVSGDTTLISWDDARLIVHAWRTS